MIKKVDCSFEKKKPSDPICLTKTASTGSSCACPLITHHILQDIIDPVEISMGDDSFEPAIFNTRSFILSIHPDTFLSGSSSYCLLKSIWRQRASLLLVFTSGCTEVDHFRPGSNVARPIVPAPPILMSSTLRFGKVLTSSALFKLFRSAFPIGCGTPLPPIY